MSTTTTAAAESRVLVSLVGCGDTDKARSFWEGRTQDGKFVVIVFDHGNITFGVSDSKVEAQAWREFSAGFHSGWIISRDELLALLSSHFTLALD